MALGQALVRWAREPEEVEAAYRDAAEAGREAATPEGLVLAAQALSNLGIVFALWGGSQRRSRSHTVTQRWRDERQPHLRGW